MLKIAQSDHNVRPGWWEWAVWLEGTTKELDGVEEVTYTLHPTFAEPVQRVRDRATKFRLRSSGWGGFMILADVRLRGGASKELTHVLQLHIADDSAKAPSAPKTMLYLSHAPIDARLAGELARSLESRGLRVHTSASLSSDRSWSESLRNSLNSSAKVVSLETDMVSQTHQDELAKAKELGKEVFHLHVGGQMAQVPTGSKISALTDEVLRFVEPSVLVKPETKSPGAARRVSGRLKR